MARKKELLTDLTALAAAINVDRRYLYQLHGPDGTPVFDSESAFVMPRDVAAEQVHGRSKLYRFRGAVAIAAVALLGKSLTPRSRETAFGLIMQSGGTHAKATLKSKGLKIERWLCSVQPETGEVNIYGRAKSNRDELWCRLNVDLTEIAEELDASLRRLIDERPDWASSHIHEY